jgi:hypothetical protein
MRTTLIARELGIQYEKLLLLLRSGEIVPPRKDSRGRYRWTFRDLERVRRGIRAMRRKEKNYAS